MKSLTFQFHQDFLFFAQTASNPSQGEWDSLLALIRGRVAKPRAVFISSEGGSPSALQRKQLREALNELSSAQRPPLVMFTGSSLVRMSMTALKAFVSTPMIAYAPTQWEEAARHLGLTAEEALEAARTLNSMRAELGLAPLREPQSLANHSG